MKKELICGVGDIVVTNQPDVLVRTFALGSCVAVIFYSPGLKLAGMAHIALPDSKVNPQRARQKPGYYADTAIETLIRKLKKMGVKKNSQVWIKLIGGANILDKNEKFNIGKRNVLAVKRQLWRYKLGAIAEDVGKDYSRTVTLDMNTGRILITSPGRPAKIL